MIVKSSGIFVSSSSQGAGTDAGTQLPGNFTRIQLFRQQQSTSILLKLATLLSGLHYRSGYPCSQRMLNKLHKRGVVCYKYLNQNKYVKQKQIPVDRDKT